MLYPVYAAAALVCLGALVLLLTLNQTREFLGRRGIEYCWMYGSFQRYLYTHLTLIGVDTAVLGALYWLALRNYLLVYLIVAAAGLRSARLLSRGATVARSALALNVDRSPPEGAFSRPLYRACAKSLETIGECLIARFLQIASGAGRFDSHQISLRHRESV